MTVLDAAAAERGKLRRVLGRLDTVFFLISAMVVVNTAISPDVLDRPRPPVFSVCCTLFMGQDTTYGAR